MATGLVFRLNSAGFDVVDSYYAATGREPTRKGPLALDAKTVKFNTFKELCEKLLSSRRSHVVIVCHGSPTWGMEIPITRATHINIGAYMFELNRLVDMLDHDQDITDKAKDLAQSVGLKGSADIVSLAKTCQTIRGSVGICAAVHVRGCDIGKTEFNPIGGSNQTPHIRLIQRLFNAKVVSAPDCPMFYVGTSPTYPPDDPKHPEKAAGFVDAYQRTHPVKGRRFIYTASDKGPFLLDIHYKGTTTDRQSAVTAYKDIRSWAKHFHENSATPSVSHVPLAGLWPQDGPDVYFLAHEPGYIDRLAAVTG